MFEQLVMVKPSWSQRPPTALLGWSWEPGEAPAGAGLREGEGRVTSDAE